MKLFANEFGEGKPILILHGLFGSSDNWQTFSKRLASAGCRVIAADLRNHGRSPHSDEFNFDLLAGDVRELIQDKGLPEVTLVGHSLGGKTAMKLAFDFPELVSHLIVIDIAPRAYPIYHRQIIDALRRVDFSVIQHRSQVEAILKPELTGPEVLQFFLKNIYWRSPDRLDWRFNLDAIDHHLASVGEAVVPLELFNRPTLFVKGEKSDYITYDDERDIFNLFSDVELLTAPGAGHWVHADNPQWLMDQINEFGNSTR